MSNENRPGAVVVIGTGGTIASRDTAQGVSTPVAGAGSLVAGITAPGNVTVRAVDFAAHSDYPLGWDIDWALLCDLGAFVERELAAPDALGVVVTHGTDVLEEVAAFLHLTVASDKPVVITGAMRNQSHPGADGASNLNDAVAIAAHPDARGRGTIVALNGRLLSAADATKADTTAVDAFTSPNARTLGRVDRAAVRFTSPPHRPATYAVTAEPAPRIPLLWAASCTDPDTLDLVTRACDGVVIAGTGMGHVPSAWVPRIQALVSEGTPVVIASRCGAGPTGIAYAGPGGGQHLAEAGAILAGDRRPLQTRIELMCAIASGAGLGEARAHFTRPTGFVANADER